MIRKATENILNELHNKGIIDQADTLDMAKEIISTELEKYELKERITAIVVHDQSDMGIIGRFFVAKTTSGLSPNSLRYYRCVLQKFFTNIGKHVKDIVADDVRIYLSRLRMDGCQNSTLNNERRVLSSFYGWAFDEELIEKNPMKRVEGIKQKKVQRKPLTEDEMELLREAAKNERDRAMIEFLYSTGCRISEMTAVDRNEIDWETREVIVTGKGNKQRIVYLSPRCISALRSYLKLRKDKDPALFISEKHVEKDQGTGKWQWVENPHRLDKSSIECIIRKAGLRAGIDNVHPHRIRRTCATLALRRGMPIEQVSKMLGHESIETTTIYASSTLDEVKRSHEKYIS